MLTLSRDNIDNLISMLHDESILLWAGRHVTILVILGALYNEISDSIKSQQPFNIPILSMYFFPSTIFHSCVGL